MKWLLILSGICKSRRYLGCNAHVPAWLEWYIKQEEEVVGFLLAVIVVFALPNFESIWKNVVAVFMHVSLSSVSFLIFTFLNSQIKHC